MLRDIESKIEIEELVQSFYKHVLADDLLKPFFTEVVQTNFEKHIPVMVNFWENAIFYTGSYAGNPLESHRHIHAILPFQEIHFDRWLTCFTKAVDELFVGTNADSLKQKATSISAVMKLKLIPPPPSASI